MMDLSSLTDEQLLQLEQQQSNNVDLKSLSDEELLNLESQYSQNMPGNMEVQAIPEQKPKQEKSPLSFWERLDLSFADDTGRQERLKQKYSIVQQLPNGKFAVGNSINDIRPIDPEGMFNDVLGDLADVAAAIPMVIGQSVGAGLGLFGASPLSVTAGAGVGAFAGEAVARGIGKFRGVDLRKNEELVADSAIAGLFGTVGEGLGQALKFTGKGLSKIGAKYLDKTLSKTKNPSMGLKAISKIFRVTAAVKEKDTIAAGMYGFERTLSAPYTNPNHVRTLTTKLVDGVVRRNSALGKAVGYGDDWAKANFGNKTLELTQSGLKLLNTLSDDSVGLIDDIGRLSRGSFTVFDDYRTIKQLTDLFFDADDLGKLVPKNVKLSKAIDFKKRTGTVLRSYFKSGRVNPKAERAIAQYMDDVSNIIAQETTTKTPIQQMNPYIKANRAFRQWKEDLKLLKANGLDLEDVTKLKTFTRNVGGERKIIHKQILDFAESLEKKNEATQEAFGIIADHIGVKFAGGGLDGKVGTLMDELMKWNAAQGFTNSNPSLLRLGAVAGLTGMSLGQGESGSAAKRLGLGLLLGTPAGAKLIFKGAAKTKAGLMNAAQKSLSSKVLDDKVLRALLTRYITQRSKTWLTRYITQRSKTWSKSK